MEYSTAIVSALFGFVLGCLTLWKWNKLSEKALSKMDGKNVKKVTIKNDEIVLEADGQNETLKKEKEEAEKKLEAKIKQLGCLERDFEHAWEPLKKAIEAAEKSNKITNDFVRTSNEFKKISQGVS